MKWATILLVALQHHVFASEPSKLRGLDDSEQKEASQNKTTLIEGASSSRSADVAAFAAPSVGGVARAVVAPTSTVDYWAPGLMMTDYDELCLDYNMDTNNIYMSKCHGRGNQQFVFSKQGQIRTMYDYNCMEVTETLNVQMADCAAKPSQQWYFVGSTLRNRAGDKCLDYFFEQPDRFNVYMSNCHGNNNQRWYHVQPRPITSQYWDENGKQRCLDYSPSGSLFNVKSCDGGKNQQLYITPSGYLKSL